MKTIIWKELREHARWVPLGFVPVLAVLILVWRADVLVFGDAPALSAYGPAASMGVGFFIALLACVIATSLGLLQSWSDHRADARALLLHRGITADSAFSGKLLAGLLLYAGAVWLPLLGMAAFIAFVGIEHRAASPGALLPWALISIVAFSCWPTSLLVVQRDAWFVGSRLLPAVTAALAVLIFISFFNPALWLAGTIAAATLVAFLVAARSVFVTGGHASAASGRVSLTPIVTVALLTITMCLVSMFESYRMSAAYSNSEAVTRQHTVEFGPDGRPWLARATYSRSTGEREVQQVAKMLPDQSVRDRLEAADDSWKPLRKWSPYHYGIYYAKRWIGGRFIQLNQASIRLDADDELYRQWVFDAKRDVILVYRNRLRERYQLEATLSPPTSVVSFGQPQRIGSVDPAGNFTLITSTGVYRVSGLGAKVETIYAVPKSAKYLGAELPLQGPMILANRAFVPQADSMELLLRLNDRVVFLGSREADAAPGAKSVGVFEGTKEVFVTEVQLPDELATANYISIAVDPAEAGSYVGLIEFQRRYEEQVSWFRFDREGRIVEREQYADGTVTAIAFDKKYIVALMPPVVYAFGAVLAAIENKAGDVLSELWEQAKKHPAEAVTVVFLGLLQPIVGILLAVWAGRRRGLDKRAKWRWICFAFWLGPYGSLAILAVYPRILRDRCPACQKATRIDVAHCEHCACSLDEPPATGIEIFDRDRSTPTITTQPASV